ncbi:hypothetical protein HG421_18220 [Xanthomonas campestris pv. badrii]|uniref:Uncharacterized protein n=1 Tax=Xanthomonas campestris pv. badrii TaxID=149696 RepID=A0A7Z2V7G0_XANCA|nr:hypothetical protein [Xanthomonas campestris]QJD66273.1 hypothetical protein HG421_18220 [Xanthomonas campestris pv. badrii]
MRLLPAARVPVVIQAQDRPKRAAGDTQARAGWQSRRREDDAGFLSTAQAGGFVGSMIGPFARLQPDRTKED